MSRLNNLNEDFSGHPHQQRNTGADDNRRMNSQSLRSDLLSGAVALSHWGVIRARGPDAASFLQGQLTQDVLKLDGSRATLAGYCSPKGRLLASFMVCEPAADELLLVCHASVLAATLKRLSMFVMRARCKLTDASAELPMWGVVGDAANPLLGASAVWGRHEIDGASCIRLPDVDGLPRAVVIPADALPSLPGIDLTDWRRLEVRSGIATIEAATADQFVPQMINFEQVGGVNFQKGCYPGQEVVARSQYRGTIKRRSYVFDADVALAPGQEVFHNSDAAQPAGRVVNAAGDATGRGFSALVEVKMAMLDSGSLHLGAADGPLLRQVPLPYEFSFEA